MRKECSSTNYYEILQVNPRADQEIIERVYRLMVKRYHPDNAYTGDAEQFKMLNEAYRVLSDPEKRATYDGNHKSADAYQNNIPNALQPGSTGGERTTRQAILLMLYFTRRRDSMKPGVGIIDLEELLGLPEKETEFHTWYLKEKGWIQRLETGEIAITANGVDEIIEDDLLSKKNHLLPYFNRSLEKENADKNSNLRVYDP